MELRDYLIRGNRIRFESIRPMQKICLIRNARDGHQRAYVGTVKQLRKPNTYVLDMYAEEHFEDGAISTRFKPKELSFKNSSDISVYILESVGQDAKAKLAEERRAYAKARRALQEARAVENEHFTILGINENITEQEFKLLKKRVMLKWHPDRATSSSLSPEQFAAESKKYTDALSWVSNYLSNKLNRTKK